MSNLIDQSPKEARRQRNLENIDKLGAYIAQDELDEDTQGVETLRNARKNLVLDENDEQYKEFNALSDKKDDEKKFNEFVNAFGDAEGEDYDAATARSDARLEDAEATLSAHKEKAAAFSATHLDVLEDEAMKLAVEAGKTINKAS